MSTLYERLKEICRDAGIQKPRSIDIHVVTGLTPGRVAQIQKDPAAKLGGKKLMELSERGYNPSWLQSGALPKKLKNEMARQLMLADNRLQLEEPDADEEIGIDEESGYMVVARVKFKLSAGVTGFAIEPDEEHGKPIVFRDDWFSINGYKPEKLFSVRVSGASMEPSLWDGDIVVVNTADTKPTDGDAFALNYEGELVVKRMRRDAGEWFAASDNPNQARFPPKRCTEDVKIIGRIVYKQSDRI